uniref:Peptidase M1 membrane alanine aminopeptidase domain-containing protein n=1 Tax=Glossina austeni TaxID=7395 RepID=A0A1A9VXV6_GLOAU
MTYCYGLLLRVTVKLQCRRQNDTSVTELLKTASDICGPYVWKQYDLLVMLPSFPFGGVENPCLTFVTPTLLAGHKSLADVVAHEIVHSWTGTLVTNKNFEHLAKSHRKLPTCQRNNY